MSLLQNQEIISFLKDHASDTETSRSAYWNNEVPNFSIAADGSLDGSCAAGSVSTKRGLFYDAAHLPTGKVENRFSLYAATLKRRRLEQAA